MPNVPATPLHASLRGTLHRIENAAQSAGRPAPRLLAVSKMQSATAIADLVAAFRQIGTDARPALGENYVQEAAGKQAELNGLGLERRDIEWHLIGHLQSNKARDAAAGFDWVQTVDRGKLVTALARHRDEDGPPLNVLIQVNIDDEASKHGCQPGEIGALAEAIAAEPRLRLRGLMVIPTPHPDPELRRPAFARTRASFERLQASHPQVDTLSMGMSDDYAIAIEEGATMVRIGTALFGPRAL
jgi:hypothetical protein